MVKKVVGKQRKKVFVKGGPAKVDYWATREVNITVDDGIDMRKTKKDLVGKGNTKINFNNFIKQFEVIDFEPIEEKEIKGPNLSPPPPGGLHTDGVMETAFGADEHGNKFKIEKNNETGEQVFTQYSPSGSITVLHEVPPVYPELGGHTRLTKIEGNKREMLIQHGVDGTRKGEKTWEFTEDTDDNYPDWDSLSDGRVDLSVKRPKGAVATRVTYGDGTTYSQDYESEKDGSWTRNERFRDGSETTTVRSGMKTFQTSRSAEDKPWVMPSVRHQSVINIANWASQLLTQRSRNSRYRFVRSAGNYLNKRSQKSNRSAVRKKAKIISETLAATDVMVKRANKRLEKSPLGVSIGPTGKLRLVS